MADDLMDKLVWNTHVKQLILEGHDELRAFESLVFALDEANRITPVDRFSGKTAATPPDQLKVPYWAVRTLSEAFGRYRNAQEQLTLGQAFNLEGKGRGRHRTLGRHRKADEAISAAYDVQNLTEQGLSRARAIERVAEQLNMTPDKLKKALSAPDQKKLERHRAALKEKGR